MLEHSGRYLLLVLLVAAATWFVTSDVQAMVVALAAACPCALVLSAPVTAIAGIAVAERHGILIRGSAYLEELADLSSLVIDKIGTLTNGALHLRQIVSTYTDLPEQEITRLAAASSYPACRALARLVPHDQLMALTDLHERQGCGVVAATERGWGVRSCSSDWASPFQRFLSITARSPARR